MPLHRTDGVPGSTYRLQLWKEFTFADAEKLVPYLRDLGITHCYCSPILMSAPGSTHGYDVNDYRRIDPELGGSTGYENFVRALREHGMGVVLDFVPNHMGISGTFNPWWHDVLERGRHSPYAAFFDIQWYDQLSGLSRVLVPILDRHYGVALEEGAFSVRYVDGALGVAYGDTVFPLRPESYVGILTAASGRAEKTESREALKEMADDFRAFPRMTHALPAEDEKRVTERLAALKKRLAEIVTSDATAKQALDATLATYHGRAGDEHSFDALDSLLSEQHYRITRWKTGAHEINYRRFFAIDTLIGLRMENARVFADSHALLARLLRDDKVNGVRIDHIDGLRDPQEYLDRVAGMIGPKRYLTVEKILADNEELVSGWPVHGTTGYDFVRQIGDVLVDPTAESKITEIYQRFTGDLRSFEEIVAAEKRMILDEMFANAVHQLAHELADLIMSDRRWRDLTRRELLVAIREIMAELGVYRTYRRLSADCSAEDRRAIEAACARAIRVNPRLDSEAFVFVRAVLVGDYPAADAELGHRRAVWGWVMTFQQYTGAVMAKAVEDTSFYVYNRFVALNEVGGNPAVFGTDLAPFHAANRRRVSMQPHSQLASSTHDTKWSEDARGRLYALSEVFSEWADWVAEWGALNREFKTAVDAVFAPDPIEEFQFYQALLAAWPAGRFEPDDAFRERMRNYFRKAINEAKRHTTWLHPNEPWLKAADHFVDSVLSPDTGARFLASFRPRVHRLAHLGMLNSLVLLTLKTTCPGVPDFYQGSERWDLSVVDPDNRRPVDWSALAQLGAGVKEKPWPELLSGWADGGIKWRVTRDLLRFRREHAALFQAGDYTELAVNGAFANRVIAFSRRYGGERVAVLVPRLAASLGVPPLGLVWEDTTVTLGEGAAWMNVFTGRQYRGGAARVADVFTELPIAVLFCTGN